MPGPQHGRLRAAHPRGRTRRGLRRSSPRLIFSLVLVILGVVAMHQFSDDHALVAAQPPTPIYPDRPGNDSQPATRLLPDSGTHLQAIRGALVLSSAGTADCAGCDTQAWTMICLLALALLAALTTARGPTSRPLPATSRWPSDHLVRRPVRRARSWIELSVIRT